MTRKNANVNAKNREIFVEKMERKNFYNNIGWVDQYVKAVAPFIYVREEDNLLIKIPNEAHKLNPQATRMLKALLAGQSIRSLIGQRPEDKERLARDIHNFFCDLRALLKGCYHESQERRSIELVPFKLPFNTLPVLSEIALTYRCNLGCRFCYASCGCSKKEGGVELSTEEIKDVLNMIKNEAEVPSVSFTGGEPTLRSDLPELVSYAKSLGMWTNLITNATLMTKGLAASLKQSGLDSAQVSLEAGDHQLHDAIVQKKGAFTKTLEGLKNIQAEGIRVHTNTTISGLNKDQLLPVLDIVCSVGINKFSMNMLMPEGSALSELDQVLITYSDIGDVVLEVGDHAERLGLQFMWYSPTPMCIFNPVVHGLGNKGCAACDGLLSIAPNGDILPCSSYPQPMGNMLKMKGLFRKTWREPQFEYFQKKRFAHKICQECDDLAVCNGGCPLYWKQVGFQEIEKKGDRHLLPLFKG